MMLATSQFCDEAVVQTYFYYALDEGGHIFARHDIEAASDAGAVTASWDFSGKDEEHHGFEVWVGCRLVFQSQMTADFFQADSAQTSNARSSLALAPMS
jgi:hypothetical protein